MIHPKKVGHVVLKVRDLQKVEQFYTEVLGFTVATRLKRPASVFFTLGEQYHDLAVLAVPPDADLVRYTAPSPWCGLERTERVRLDGSKRVRCYCRRPEEIRATPQAKHPGLHFVPSRLRHSR